MIDWANGGWLALGAAGGWLLKKSADTFFDHFMNRIGKVEFIPTWCAFTQIVDIPESGKVRTQYDPEHIQIEREIHQIVVDGEFVNHRKSSVLLSKPSIWFMHPNKDPFVCGNPNMTVSDIQGVVIAIPSHASVKVQFTIDVPDDMLANFKGVLPVLELFLPSGKPIRFRLKACSFSGLPIAVWPLHGDRPVYVGSLTSKQSKMLPQTNTIAEADVLA